MRLQRAICAWAAVLLLGPLGLRPMLAAVPFEGDPLFQWKQDWVETPHWGGRLGFIDARGDLKVRLRYERDGTWVVVARHVSSFQLLDWSLAVLRADGTLLTAEGALNAPLEPVAENVCAYQKTLTRLGVLQCDGTLLVKESPGSRLRAVAAGVDAFQILDDRAAFRGADGSLWAQEAGVVDRFHRLAERVTSFQLERGWIGYVEAPALTGEPSRLMLVEGSLLQGVPSLPREVARGVSDFEMEVRVDADAGFRKTLYLAVVTGDGALKIGVGESLPVALREFDRGAFCSLSWAAGRLAYLGPEGLKVAHFNTSAWPERVDSFAMAISSFRMTTEGSLLFDPEGRPSRLVDWTPPPEGALPSISQILETATGLAEDASSIAAVRMESSSIRPHFMRRPVEANLSTPAGSKAAAVSLFSNVPQARGVDPLEGQAPGQRQAASTPATESVSALQQNGVPLYRWYAAGSTDHFYSTTNYGNISGFQFQGVAAYVEATQVGGSLPFQRFYMGSPRTEHFYTTNTGEAQYVRTLGFIYESIEGYLYAAQVAGTVPLYRLSWCGLGGDCDHLYTVDAVEINTMLGQGWGNDGVAGYVWPLPAPPPAPPNGAVFVSQVVPASMVPGQSYPVSVTMRNTGTNTWTAASAHHLGSQNPQDNSTWGSGRVLMPYNVAPGATVTFSFTATPRSAGLLNFQWRMVQDGVEWFGDDSPNVSVSVQPLPPGRPNSAAFLSQSVPATMVMGQPAAVSVTVQNTGTQTWTAAGLYRLGSQNPQDNGNWSIGRVDVPGSVPPGGTVTFSFSVVPILSGALNFQWRMVQDGVEWFGDFTTNVAVAVSPSSSTDNAAFVSQSVPGLMTVGQSTSVALTLRNAGLTTWTAAAGYQLSSQNPQDNVAWGAARVALPGNVAPGATVTFTFAVKPAASGMVPFQWRMVRSSSPFGAATQNVVVIVDKNPHLITGVTPYADNYISYFSSLGGSVPAQSSVRWKPYTGRECPTPFLTTSACNPGIPAWARANKPNPIINPCLTPLMVTEGFLAPHARRNIGPDANGVTWEPVGKSTYGPLNWTPCDLQVLQVTGYCHVPTQLLFWLVEADPVLAVGSGTYCPTDQKSTTRYPQGSGTREVLPGEVTPDSYAMVPSWPVNFAQGGVQPNPWRAYVPAGHKVASDQTSSQGDLFWINVPPANSSIPILGTTLLGGGDGPSCFGTDCYSIADRAMAQKLPNGQWAIAITGYMTGHDSIFNNTSDALADLGSLAGNGASNPTVDAIQNWMVANNVLNPIFFGHSLGAMDAAVLYQRGFGGEMVLFAAPWVLPITSLLPSDSGLVGGVRPVTVYSAVNDTISNMVPGFSGCVTNSDTCRIANGVPLIEINTGSGFLTGSNPHDRCKYQAFYFGGECRF